MRRLLSLLAVVVAALTLTVTGSAQSSYAHAYVDELTLGHAIESRGVYYGAKHVNIENAACTGLRYLGVQTSAYGLDKFWRFQCDLDAVNNHIYTAQISTTTGPRAGYFYWHLLSIKKEF